MEFLTINFSLIKNIKVTNLDDETRIDRWLKKYFSSLSQSFIEKKLRKGNIKVNKKKIKSNYKVVSGDVISIFGFNQNDYLDEKKNNIKKISSIIIKEFKKSIIYENEDFIIINKLPGISTQGGSKIIISIDMIIKNINLNYNLVHRLDKETSGLLIISKNIKSTRLFGNLFKHHKIIKRYIAVCQGIPKNSNSIVKLDINNKDKKSDKIRTITKYKVFKSSNKLSLVFYMPVTGKTHQLRIVSKYLNTPIIGDAKYNISNKFKSEKLKLNACYLNFIFKEKEYRFISKLPKHFFDFMKKNELIYDIEKYLKKL